MRSLFLEVGLFGKFIALCNVAVLMLLPISWSLPLLRSSVFFGISTEISILGGAIKLMRSDLFLFLVLVFFAMLIPVVKTLIYVFIWFWPLQYRPWLSKFGTYAAKLSMTDVFLLSIMILFFKGLGVSKVEQMFGLYFFSSIVITSVLISCYTDYLQKKVLA